MSKILSAKVIQVTKEDSDMDWKEDFKKRIDNGELETDSDVEDYINWLTYNGNENMEATYRNQVWQYYYELRAKGTNCEGCKHVGCWGSYPCNECSRKIQLFDHFEK